MRWLITAATAASVGAAVGASATAGPALTKAQYLAKLRAADGQSARVDDAAGAAIGSKTATPAQVKTRFLALAKTHIAIGKSFAAITPRRTATNANADFARAETVLGQQDEAIASKLPTTKAAVMKYVQSLKPPSGGKLLDRAVNELHSAGFKV